MACPCVPDDVVIRQQQFDGDVIGVVMVEYFFSLLSVTVDLNMEYVTYVQQSNKIKFKKIWYHIEFKKNIQRKLY